MIAVYLIRPRSDFSMKSRRFLLSSVCSSSDFIFSTIGEELGFFGALAIITLFGILIWRGILIAFRAPDLFGTYTAFGLTFLIGIQAIFNLGVVTGIFPTKGLPLPFISHGGTSLVVCMTGSGIVLNISKFCIQPQRRQQTAASAPSLYA